MLIAMSKIHVKNGHFAKVIPVIKENARLGASQKGCLGTYVANNEDNCNEILVYTLWQDHQVFEEAKKEIKRDPKTKKLVFQLFPHLAEEPKMETFQVISLD